MEMAFFERTERGFEPLPMAASAWSPDMVNGPSICGLLARELEIEYGAPGFVPARLTVDLFRPTLRKPVEVVTTPVRAGRRIVVADAELVQGGEAVARATAVFLKRSEQPPGSLWTRAERPAPPPSEVLAGAGTHLWGSDAGWSESLAEHQNDTRKRAWQRPPAPVLGEAPSPFVAAAELGESASLMTNWGSAGVGFINADLTLALSRLPNGPELGIEGDSHLSADGVAVGSATLFDHDGPFGTCVVTALSNAARQVDFTSEEHLRDHALRRGDAARNSR